MATLLIRACSVMKTPLAALLLFASTLVGQSLPSALTTAPSSRTGGSQNDEIGGVLENEAGERVAGARYEVYENLSPLRRRLEDGALRARGTTDDRGVFSVARDALGPAGSFILHVQHRGYALSRTPFDVGPSSEHLVVTLTPSGEVCGTVKDSDGAALEGVSIGVFVDSPSLGGSLEASTQTDSKGVYVVAAGPGWRTIVASRKGLTTSRLGLTISAGASAVVQHFTLRPGSVIVGRVLDAHAKVPIHHAEVTAFPKKADPADSRPAPPDRTFLTTRTDADGIYTLEGADTGGYVVTVNADGYRIFGADGSTWPRLEIEKTPARDVDFDLEPGARIRGRVVDDVTSRPVTNFRAGITMDPARPFSPPPVLRTFDDRFELLDVPPAKTVWVFATAPGYAGGRSAEIILGQRESREGVDVRLIRGGCITGRVTGPDGIAVADASIVVDAAEDSTEKTAFDRALKNELRSHAPRVRSSSVGSFLLPNLPPGSFKLVVSHPDFVTREVQPIVVVASQRTVVPDVLLSRGARIRGRVRRQDGSPDRQAVVQVTSLADPDRMSGSQVAYTEHRGRFEVTGLAAGQYRIVVVQREGLVNMPRPFRFVEPNIVTLEVGEMKELDL